MRLSEFIEQAHDEIIEEWVAFAATLLPWAKGMDENDLRDHAVELLSAVVRDMESPQSSAEQDEKSKGQDAAGGAHGDLAIVGQLHAAQRLKSGFKIEELVSEYRALRASVLRLWAEAQGDQHNDVTRFNEAIDESLTESVNWYAEEVNRTREQFLAILGHDLRSPLSAITMGARLLTRERSGLDDQHLRVATRIGNSATRMERMVNDLLDLTRTRLGSGIPVTLSRVDLEGVCHQVFSEVEVTHPDHALRFTSQGDLRGEWDSDRIYQLLSNLVANALQYGDKDRCVSVSAEEDGEEVTLRVHNDGEHIPANSLERIFDPMFRGGADASANANGMGLGLYIVREIVRAHHGTIDVTSTEQEGTAFAVRLPRHPPKQRRYDD